MNNRRNRRSSSRRFVSVLKKIERGESLEDSEHNDFASVSDAGFSAGMFTSDGIADAKITPNGAKYLHETSKLLFEESLLGQCWGVFKYLLAAIIGGFIVAATTRLVDVAATQMPNTAVQQPPQPTNAKP